MVMQVSLNELSDEALNGPVLAEEATGDEFEELAEKMNMVEQGTLEDQYTCGIDQLIAKCKSLVV